MTNKSEIFNIFLVVHDFSGALTYANELSAYLVTKKKFRVYQVFLKDKDYKEFTITYEDHITRIYIPSLKFEIEHLGKYYERAAFLLYSVYGLTSNLLFHCNNSNHYFFAEALKKYFRVPIVYTYHFLENYFSSIDYEQKYDSEISVVGDSFEKNILQMSDFIICVTDFGQRIVTRFYNIRSDKTIAIHNGARVPYLHDQLIDKRKLKEEYGFATDLKVILMAGQIERRKGIDTLVKAFIDLQKEMPDTILIIAGTGNYDIYMEYSQKLPGKIYYTGKLPKEKLIDFYLLSDVGVMPSRFEQCSYTAIEMMHHGLPLIISDVPGLNELVEHEKTGLKVGVSATDLCSGLEIDQIDLKNQLLRILRHPKWAKQLSNNAAKYAQQHLNYEYMGEQTLKIYEQLLKKNRLRPFHERQAETEKP